MFKITWFQIIRHVPNYLVLDDSTCSKLSRSALHKPSHQYKTEFSVSFYWEDFLKKHISTLSSALVAREPPIMTLDRLTGQLERDTKSPRGKFFLSICISVILLHHCIERKEFKGNSTFKSSYLKVCLNILRQEKVQGTVTRKFAMICHSSAKRLALMLKGC